MARGKQAARAANRRAEAALQLLERQNDALADAKVRAKIAETDSSLVDHLQAECRRVRAELDEANARQRDAVNAALAEREREVELVMDFLMDVLKPVFDHAYELKIKYQPEVFDGLRAVFGQEYFASVIMRTDTRSARRRRVKPSAWKARLKAIEDQGISLEGTGGGWL